MINITERITALRLERKWSEYQLAEKSGITQSTIFAGHLSHGVTEIHVPCLEPFNSRTTDHPSPVHEDDLIPGLRPAVFCYQFYFVTIGSVCILLPADSVVKIFHAPVKYKCDFICRRIIIDPPVFPYYFICSLI